MCNYNLFIFSFIAFFVHLGSGLFGGPPASGGNKKRVSEKKELKAKQKMLKGWDLEACEIKFAQGIWRGPAGTFFTIFHSKFRASCGRPQCVLPPFRDLLLQLLNPYHTISAVTALQAAAQLEVACPIFCVLRDEHLSIDRPVCPFFAWPAINSSCSKLLVGSSAIPLLL